MSMSTEDEPVPAPIPEDRQKVCKLCETVIQAGEPYISVITDEGMVPGEGGNGMFLQKTFDFVHLSDVML